MTRFIWTLACLSACAGSKGSDGPPEDFSWAGGTFIMTTIAVDDDCDIGMSLLLLPEGAGSTREWPDPVEVPSWEDMESPVTYEIQLQDPFEPMDVTVTQGAEDGLIDLSGALQEDVLFDPDNYEDCLIDIRIDADVVVDDDTSIHGQAALSIIDADGEYCPQFPTPCNVTLDFTGAASG